MSSSRRLAYYATQLPDKDTWFQTPEGYRIYKNVPIARTGFQDYLGRELKKNPGYQEDWDFGDDQVITVYRPLEEVAAAEAVASFEGKSVLDEHPPDPQVLVDAIDEYEGVSKGHAHNVRTGIAMGDGETATVADLIVKHPDLNIKIDEQGVRDVSCGYTFVLAKDADGRFIQTQIRGNHVAIVPKGRAGPLYGIGDAAPIIESKGRIMTTRLLRALGFQAFAKDAKPEDVAAALDSVEEEDKEAKKAEAKDKAAKDKAKDADEDEEIKHAKDCGCKDCKGARDKKGSKDKAKDAEEGEDGMTDADEDEKEEKKSAKDEAEILPANERARSEFSVGDSAALLDALKPAVARSKDPAVKNAYEKLRTGIKAVQTGVKDGAPDPFAALTRINAAGAADDEPEIPVSAFFNGVSYAEGLKRYNEHLSRTQTR